MSKYQANERTCLLGGRTSSERSIVRVYSNGSLPLTSSYDDLRESAEIQMQALIDRNKKPDKEQRQNILQQRHAVLILVVGCALSVALIFLMNFHPKLPSADDRTGKEHPLPFSLLDPVHDLGFMEYTRPEQSSPPKHLFKRQRSTKQRSALPTNAFYQNMLLAHEEPTTLNRVYNVQYILEAVGLIPGLHIHPANNVLASTSVMQLSFNENFGLSLGAAEDLKKSPKRESETFSYTVLETTELGLTLEWVSEKSRFRFGLCLLWISNHL